MTKVVDWLLQGDSWVQYRVRVNLPGEFQASREAQPARKAMLVQPRCGLTEDKRVQKAARYLPPGDVSRASDLAACGWWQKAWGFHL